VAGAVVVVVVEVGSRAFLGPPMVHWLTEPGRDEQADFDVIYAVKPNGTRVTCAPNPPNNAPQIYFIGDSTTFGQGVENLKDFVGLLSCRFPQFEFQNYGSLGQGLNYYRMVIDQQISEQTISAFLTLYENDLPTLGKNSVQRNLRHWLYRNSHLYSSWQKLKKKLRYIIAKRATKPSTETGGPDKFNNPRKVFSSDPNALQFVISLNSEMQEVFKEELKILLLSAKRQNTKIKFYMSFVPEASTVSDRHRTFYKSVGASTLPPLGKPSPAYTLAKEVCDADRSCEFIDIFPDIFGSHGTFYHPSDFHWNEEGHRYMAEKLSSIISRDLAPLTSNPVVED